MHTYIRAFSDNATVFTIIDLMAKKFGFIPRYLYRVEDEKASKQEKLERKANQRRYQRAVKYYDPNTSKKQLKELIFKAYQDDVVDNSPLSILLNRPNEYQGQDSYYTLLYAFKKATGNSFEWLNRGDNDLVTGNARYKLPILERHILPPDQTFIVIDRSYKFGLVQGYQYYQGGMPIFIPKEDVIHWKSPNPIFDTYNFSHLYGMSPLKPGRKLITQDDAQVDSAVAMFQNGGARGVLYNETMDNLTPEQVSASDSAIDTKINNRAMKSAVAMLPGKWGYLYTGLNAVDSDLIDAQDKTFQRIANLLGANPQLWETKTTFNNVAQARKDLITNAILPDAASYRDEENRVLLQAFGYTQSQYCIDIDVTDLPELQDDMVLLTTRVMSNWALTPNQKLEELGYDKSPDPDMDLVYIPTTFTLLEDAAVSTASLDPNSGSDPTDPDDSGEEIPDKPARSTRAGNKKRLSAREVDEAWSKTSVRA